MKKFVALTLFFSIGFTGVAVSQEIPDPAQPTELIGTYRATGVSCFRENQTRPTAAAELIGATNTVTIGEGSLQIQTRGETCSGTATYQASFQAEGPDFGSISATNGQTTTSTQQECTTTVRLRRVSGGTITPATLSQDVAHNASLPDFETAYLYDSETGTLGILSTFQVRGQPNDFCLIVHEREDEQE